LIAWPKGPPSFSPSDELDDVKDPETPASSSPSLVPSFSSEDLTTALLVIRRTIRAGAEERDALGEAFKRVVTDCHTSKSSNISKLVQ